MNRTRAVTPARDRMDEHKPSVIGLKRQRFEIGFERRHIDQRSHAVWFQHGSTIIVFTPDGFRLCENIRDGAAIKMGQPLLRSA